MDIKIDDAKKYLEMIDEALIDSNEKQKNVLEIFKGYINDVIYEDYNSNFFLEFHQLFADEYYDKTDKKTLNLEIFENIFNKYPNLDINYGFCSYEDTSSYDGDNLLITIIERLGYATDDIILKFLPVIELLLKKGIDVNALSSFVKTPPLFTACRHGYYEIVKLLIEYGADIHFIYNNESLLEVTENKENYHRTSKGRDEEYVKIYNLLKEKGLEKLKKKRN